MFKLIEKSNLMLQIFYSRCKINIKCFLEYFMLDFKKYGDAEAPLRFFEEFSKIPHGSENTAGMADYLCNFMKLDNAVERIKCIDIHEIRTRWWENLPDDKIIYRDYKNSWK